jgi:stage III sporulation protein AD
MSGIGVVLGAALLFAAASLILKNFGWRGAPVFSCLCITGVFSLLSETFSLIKDNVEQIAITADLGEYAEAVLKITGIGYLYTIGSELCSELGEVGLSKAVTAGGKLEIIIIALPFFSRILDTVTQLFT